jgi:hypothetical protein
MFREIAASVDQTHIHSFSITTVYPDTTTVQMIHRQFDLFDRAALKNVSEGLYYICQLQYNAFEHDANFISPLQTDKDGSTNFLWHNVAIEQNKLMLIVGKEDTEVYYNDALDICSKQFEGSTKFDTSELYEIDLQNKKVKKYVA